MCACMCGVYVRERQRERERECMCVCICVVCVCVWYVCMCVCVCVHVHDSLTMVWHWFSLCLKNSEALPSAQASPLSAADSMLSFNKSWNLARGHITAHPVTTNTSIICV